MTKKCGKLADLNLGEVIDLCILYEIAEAAGVSAPDIVNGRLTEGQWEAAKRKARELRHEAEGNPDADPDICGMPG